MKIGCFSSDGISIGQVDLTAIKEMVFEIEVVEVQHPRRYPKYRVSSKTIGFSSTYEELCFYSESVQELFE